MGCIALEDIEIGTLILKEKPQCSSKISIQDVARGLHSHDDHLSSLVDSFFSLKRNVQEEYLTMYNKFSDPNSVPEVSDYNLWWKKFAQLHAEKWISNVQFNVDWHFILKIICIFKSNNLEKRNGKGESVGVGCSVSIKSSRFNHSCSPNSEMVNLDICPDETQIRATFKIKKGEEICVNYYSSCLGMKKKKERQRILQEKWGFICSCKRCQDEEVNNDNETYKKFEELQEEAEKTAQKVKTFMYDSRKCLIFMEKAISCQKQMFDLAENKKAPKCFIYNMILTKWFHLEANRYRFAKTLATSKGKKEFVGKMGIFKVECEILAKISLQIAKLIFGDDSNFSREWEEKYKNFENWFKNSRYEVNLCESHAKSHCKLFKIC